MVAVNNIGKLLIAKTLIDLVSGSESSPRTTSSNGLDTLTNNSGSPTDALNLMSSLIEVLAKQDDEDNVSSVSGYPSIEYIKANQNNTSSPELSELKESSNLVKTLLALLLALSSGNNNASTLARAGQQVSGSDSKSYSTVSPVTGRQLTPINKTNPYVKGTASDSSDTGASYAGTNGEKLVQSAMKDVGISEAKNGAEKIKQLYGLNSATDHWCMYFVSTKVKEAYGSVPWGHTGQSWKAMEWAMEQEKKDGKNHWFKYGEQQLKKGDIIIWRYPEDYAVQSKIHGQNYTSHISIVESVNPDGSINTVGGNEGEAVQHKQRVNPKQSNILGFVRI